MRCCDYYISICDVSVRYSQYLQIEAITIKMSQVYQICYLIDFEKKILNHSIPVKCKGDHGQKQSSAFFRTDKVEESYQGSNCLLSTIRNLCLSKSNWLQHSALPIRNSVYL